MTAFALGSDVRDLLLEPDDPEQLTAATRNIDQSSAQIGTIIKTIEDILLGKRCNSQTFCRAAVHSGGSACKGAGGV